jgi:peptidyl-prolyl cis-trans isomerase B (cyclophilin B)
VTDETEEDPGVAATKREREYARKRQAKWEQRQAQARARRRRTWTTVAIVAVVALIGTTIVVGLTNQGSQSPAASPTPTTAAPTQPAFELPDPSVSENRTWTSTMSTSAGDIGLELDGAAAPQAVASFVFLAQQGFFDGTACHRLTTSGIFVLQCGDPTGTSTGGPGYEFGPIENAPADDVYPAGTLAMARRGGDAESMGSQFFLVYEDSTIQSDAAGGYTVFGRITSGLDVLQAVADAGVEGGASQGAPVTPVTIEGVETQ